MAPLPVARVNVDAPFSQVGLDMMGPFKVKMGNSRASHKVNVAIFSCLETRSVHAEIVYKMDASSLINALSRFVARRPGLKRIISDQGTNFKGADNLLKRETEELRKKFLRSSLTHIAEVLENFKVWGMTALMINRMFRR